LKYRCDVEGCAAVCSTTRSLAKHKELHEQQNRNEIIQRHLLSLRWTNKVRSLINTVERNQRRGEEPSILS
jgi:hypothetical protein